MATLAEMMGWSGASNRPFSPPPVYNTPPILGENQPGGMFASAPPKRSTADRVLDGITAFSGILNANMGGAPGQAYLQQQAQERAAMHDERQQQSAFQQRLALARQTAEIEQNKPQAVNLGSGGFATWSPGEGFSVIREPAAASAPSSESERLIELATNPNTPKAVAALARQAIRGTYTPAMEQQQHDRVELKSVPTYAATHPRPASAPKPAATRVVNGTAYYKVNGAWYDNPEGR